MRFVRDPMFKRAPHAIKDRHERFASFNSFIRSHGGWVVSVPGDKMVTVEMLPQSNLANVLADLGHNLEPLENGERNLPFAISENFARNSDGSLGIVTEGSTRPITTVVHHAGITPTRRYRLALPE